MTICNSCGLDRPCESLDICVECEKEYSLNRYHKIKKEEPNGLSCPCGEMLENKELLELHLIEIHYINGDFSPILTDYIASRREMISVEEVKSLIGEMEKVDNGVKGMYWMTRQEISDRLRELLATKPTKEGVDKE